MKTINYLTFFEIATSNFTISAIGYLCGFLKMFTSHEITLILSVVHNISVALMIFREIGQHDLKPKTWAPLLVSFLVQVALHFLLLFGFLIKRNEASILQYIRALFSTVYFNGIYCATTIVQTVFGLEYTYIVVYCYIIHNLFIGPVHNIIIYMNSEDVDESDSSDSVETEKTIQAKKSQNGNKTEEAESGSLDDIHVNERDLDDTENEMHHTAAPIDQSNSPSDNSDHSNQQSTDEHHNQSTSQINLNSQHIEIEDSSDSSKEKKKKATPLWRVLLFSFINPCNVAVILGIIWSATGWSMPIFLSTFTSDHEKAVMAPGLFAIGAYLWDHPFLGGNAIEITVFFLIHTIVMPLLAILFCFLLNLDHIVSIIIVITHIMPVGLIGYRMCLHYKMKLLSPSFTFFWTNLLALPIQMIWCAIINETHLFQIE